MPSAHDLAVLRELAARVAELAALPVQEEKRVLWRALNALRPARPMVMIDQVCWNEMNLDDELTLRCEDPECRGYEDSLRRTLFQWRHFPVDMVVEPFLRVPKAVHNTGFGVGLQEETAVTDPTNSVVGHRFLNQFRDEGDLEKVGMPRVSHDAVETERRLALAHEIFDGLLEVRAEGVDPYLSLWDPIDPLDHATAGPAAREGVEEAVPRNSRPPLLAREGAPRADVNTGGAVAAARGRYGLGRL